MPDYPARPPGWLLTKELFARWGKFGFWPAAELLLTEGRDWVRLAPGSLKQGDGWQERAAFRPEAVEAIALYKAGQLNAARDLLLGRPIEAPPTSIPLEPGEQPPRQDAPLEEDLAVVSHPRAYPDGVRHFPNPRVILARRTNGDVVSVRVAASRHFTPRLTNGDPMVLRARRSGWPPFWSLVGRLPRWPGRW